MTFRFGRRRAHKRVPHAWRCKPALRDGLGWAFGFRFDVGEAGLDDFFDEGGGEGFVDVELDGAFGEFVGLELRLELCDDASGGEEGAVVGEGSKPDQNLFVFEGGNAVADDFGDLAGSGGVDGRAEFLERGALGLGNGGEVLVDSGGRRLLYRRGFACRRFGFLHGRNGAAICAGLEGVL
jgi:hypothetical protein